MSGSDYTLTPYLGLYKPNYALDVGQWGNHLNANADVLDDRLQNIEALHASFGTQSGAPALFDGTTPFVVTNNPTYTTASGHSLFVNGTYSGTTTDTGQPTLNLLLGYDGIHAPNANSITNVANYYTVAGSIGARIAQQISFNVGGDTADPPGNLYFFQGLSCTATVNGRLGGTAGSHAGNITGNNTIATLGTNGKYISGMLGIEIDVAAMAGSSVHYKGGLLVALQGLDAVESDAAPSDAIGIGLSSDSPASKGWGHGLAFGSAGGWWPMNPTTGIMIYANPAAITGGPAHTCASGVDFSAVTFSTAAFKSTGFQVDGTGRVSATRLNLSGLPTSATGLVAGDVWRNGTVLNIV